ncbi:MAG: accessory factor UbiK family protein, partial [Burkholderiaceae bacterium]|nr:accessory factor UbiK family protein [Burkholderiaceae bacterium]
PTRTFPMIDLKAIDELARRLGELVPPGLEAARADIEKNMRAVLQAGLARLDLVTREEFEVQQLVLRRTREKLEALERAVAALEAEGRSNDAAAKFISGECAMMTQSSGGHGAIARDAKFSFGVAPLPFWPDVAGAPFATTIGGASLWVFNAPNRSPAEYRGVALFLNYLRSTPVMTDWAKQTGFLPATNAAFKAMREEGFFQKNPGRDVPILSLIEGKQGEHTAGYRFGRWTEIRDIYHEEVERALQGKQTVAAALQNAQRRGNELLRAFERSVN